MIQLRLSWWQAWICVWIGYGIVAPFIVLNARPGAVFHVTFPVVARTSFGIYGSLWCTLNRGVMAWYADSDLFRLDLFLVQHMVRRPGKHWGRLCQSEPSRVVAECE